MHPILLFAISLAGLAALVDWRTRTIPNWLTVGTIAVAPWALGFYTASQSGHGWTNDVWRVVLASYIGLVACGFVPFVLFVRDIAGAGDVKLFAALGAVVGAKIGIELEFYSFVVAALVGPAKLAYHGTLFRTMRSAALVAIHPTKHVDGRQEVLEHMMSRFALAPAVFVGTVVTAWLHWRAV